jgi:hypothetical protein
VKVRRFRDLEHLLQVQVNSGAVEEVGAPNDRVHTLKCIVHDYRQVIGGKTIPANDQIVALGRVDARVDATLDPVDERPDLRLDANSHRGRPPAVNAGSTGPGVTASSPIGLLDLFSAAYTPVRITGADQGIRGASVRFEPRTLVQDRTIPVEPECV